MTLEPFYFYFGAYFMAGALSLLFGGYIYRLFSKYIRLVDRDFEECNIFTQLWLLFLSPFILSMESWVTMGRVLERKRITRKNPRKIKVKVET